jgi:hypothetical protein
MELRNVDSGKVHFEIVWILSFTLPSCQDELFHEVPRQPSAAIRCRSFVDRGLGHAHAGFGVLFLGLAA